MVSTASTNALPMNCPWRNKLSPSPRPRRGVHIVKVCPVDNIYLLCYTATCLSSIAGTGYSSPFPSHQGVHTRWFGRALDWQSRGQRFDPAYLHQKASKPYGFDAFFLSFPKKTFCKMAPNGAKMPFWLQKSCSVKRSVVMLCQK